MPVQKVTGQGHSGQPSRIKKKYKMELPTKSSGIPQEVNAYTYFIYGVQKIGKTSFTTQFPSCLHIMFEPSGRAYDLFEVQPNCWEEFIALIESIEEARDNETLDFKTFALDTVDLCYDMCATFVCKQDGVEHLSDGAFGSLYQRAEVEFRKSVERLAKCGGFIALSHNKEKEVPSRNGTTYTTMGPSAQKKANLVLAKFCDLTGYYHNDDNGNAVLQVGTSVDVESGNRMKPFFKFTDGTPMQEIQMGSSEEEAYANFNKAFRNEFVRPKPVEQKPAVVKPAVKSAPKALKLRNK